MTKIDKETKDKWIEALRSGDYEQCQDVLTDGTGFCCLGVLQKVRGEEVVGEGVGLFNGTAYTDPENFSYEDTFGSLLGYNYLGEEFWDCLSVMNDSGSDFLEIADYIEENLETE